MNLLSLAPASTDYRCLVRLKDTFLPGAMDLGMSLSGHAVASCGLCAMTFEAMWERCLGTNTPDMQAATAKLEAPQSQLSSPVLSAMKEGRCVQAAKAIIR